MVAGILRHAVKINVAASTLLLRKFLGSMMQNAITQFCKTCLPQWQLQFLKSLRSMCVYTKNTALYALLRAIRRKNAASVVKSAGSPMPPNIPEEIRAFMVVRNESLRLPFILDYYLSIGVDRFFVIDNNSTDDTARIVTSYPKTHPFFTADNYANQGYWIDLLLRRYGIGHWCLIIDADELFIYPKYETVTLKQLCSYLEEKSVNAMDCVLLDMYPATSLTQVHYKPGADPLLIASWFDLPSYTERVTQPAYIKEATIYYEGPARLYGGMRKRVFDVDSCLSKFPLVKFDKSMFLSPGTHFIQNARISNLRGALLHFKFLQDFSENVEREVARGQHYQNATEYKGYAVKPDYCSDIPLTGSLSEKFDGSDQLVTFGIMKSPKEFELFAKVAGSI